MAKIINDEMSALCFRILPRSGLSAPPRDLVPSNGHPGNYATETNFSFPIWLTVSELLTGTDGSFDPYAGPLRRSDDLVAMLFAEMVRVYLL